MSSFVLTDTPAPRTLPVDKTGCAKARRAAIGKGGPCRKKMG